jgi:hypothetical protein
MSKKVTCRDFKRYPGSVFVTLTNIPDTAKVQMKAKDWTGIATDIVRDTPLTHPEPTPVKTREHQPVQRKTPSEMLSALRARQTRETKQGMQKVKAWRNPKLQGVRS